MTPTGDIDATEKEEEASTSLKKAHRGGSKKDVMGSALNLAGSRLKKGSPGKVSAVERYARKVTRMKEEKGCVAGRGEVKGRGKGGGSLQQALNVCLQGKVQTVGGRVQKQSIVGRTGKHLGNRQGWES